jgi:anti-sigma factor RsiW
MGEAAAAAIAMKIRRIVDAFRRAGATSPAAARSLAELDLRESWIANRLIKRGVLLQGEPGRYYLDEKGWQAFRRARRRRLIIAATIILALALVILLVNGVGQ